MQTHFHHIRRRIQPLRLRGSMAGITLIELMIAVVVVAILAGIAYPSYTNYVVRSNRVAAQTQLYNLANRQEQYLLDARQYAPSVASLGYTVPAELAGKYTFAISVSGTGYTLTATPVGTQATRDTRCGVMTLNQLGARTEAGTAASVTDCW